MSIAPIPDMPGFGVTPGFGLNPAYGVAATPPKPDTTTPMVGQAQTVQSFTQILQDKIMELSNLHNRSDQLAIKAATGDLKDIHEYTIAANQANVATQLVVAVRNKGMEAFNDIMRMQL